MFSLHGDRAREHDVILEVDVLVQVGFEALQGLVERTVTRAGVLRDRIFICNGTQGA